MTKLCKVKKDMKKFTAENIVKLKEIKTKLCSKLNELSEEITYDSNISKNTLILSTNDIMKMQKLLEINVDNISDYNNVLIIYKNLTNLSEELTKNNQNITTDRINRIKNIFESIYYLFVLYVSICFYELGGILAVILTFTTAYTLVNVFIKPVYYMMYLLYKIWVTFYNVFVRYGALPLIQKLFSNVFEILGYKMPEISMSKNWLLKVINYLIPPSYKKYIDIDVYINLEEVDGSIGKTNYSIKNMLKKLSCKSPKKKKRKSKNHCDGMLDDTHREFLKSCEDGVISRVREIYDNDKDVLNMQDEYGMSGLMYASLNNRIEVVRYLLGLRDINIFLENIEEDTALKFAVKNNNIDVVNRILRLFDNESINNILFILEYGSPDDKKTVEPELFYTYKFDYIYMAFQNTGKSPEIRKFIVNTYPRIEKIEFI